MALWRADNVNHLQKYNDNGLAECTSLGVQLLDLCVSFTMQLHRANTYYTSLKFFLGIYVQICSTSSKSKYFGSSIQSSYSTIPMFSSFLTPWLSSWCLRAYPMPYRDNSCDYCFCARVYRRIYVCVHIRVHLVLSLAHCLPSCLLMVIYPSDFVFVYQIVSLHVCSLCLPRCQLPNVSQCLVLCLPSSLTHSSFRCLLSYQLSVPV